jgi:hypothetical protein
LAAFLPTAPERPPAAPTTSLAPRTARTGLKRRPFLMGWLVVLWLVGAILGVACWLDPHYLSQHPVELLQHPVELAGAVSAVLGLALVVSPWLGRPKWLAPAAGLWLTVGTLFLVRLYYKI